MIPRVWKVKEVNGLVLVLVLHRCQDTGIAGAGAMRPIEERDGREGREES